MCETTITCKIHRAVQIQIQKAGYPDQNECGDTCDHGIDLS